MLCCARRSFLIAVFSRFITGDSVKMKNFTEEMTCRTLLGRSSDGIVFLKYTRYTHDLETKNRLDNSEGIAHNSRV